MNRSTGGLPGERFDGGVVAVCLCEARFAGDQGKAEHLGKGDELAVVGGDRGSEFPDPVGKRVVGIAVKGELRATL